MTEDIDHLILRFDAPLQSWGSVAMDPIRPTHPFPTRSALAGIFASALGWRYRDGARTTALQDAVHYAVREDRPPRRMRDYQTADLGRIGLEGWSRWGVEKRGGASAKDTQQLYKEYLAGGVFMVAATLGHEAPIDLDVLADALNRPARPLFLGRKGCVPACRILVGRVHAPTPYEALERWPIQAGDVHVDRGAEPGTLPCWYADGEGPASGESLEIWDRRDFSNDRFAGSRAMRQGKVSPIVPHPDD